MLLPASVWQPPDGTANNLAPACQRLKGSQTNAVHYLVWAFDGAGGLEQVYVTFVMPANYASGGSLIILWHINSITAANVVWQASLSAVTAADADTILEHAFSTAATVTSAVNATEARRVITATITLNMDSAAAGDVITIRLFRDSANGSDTSTVDAELVGCEFSYVTS